MSDAGSRRVSDEIIAVAQAMKQQGGSFSAAARSFPADDVKEKATKKKKACCAKEDEAADIDTLKAELVMDDHMILITSLLDRMGGGEEYASVEYVADAEGQYDVHSPFLLNRLTLKGLSPAAVAAKQEEFGLNVLTPPKSKNECVVFVEMITDFFSMLLWVGSALCFLAYGLQSTVDNLALALVLAGVVLLTGTFGYFQDKKASNLMESFKNMMPETATVVRDGGDEVIDASQLVPGDIVKIKYGEQIPADVRLLWASDDMSVDNSSLTGEPEALRRTIAFTDDNPLETSNLAFFGTTCPKGQAVAVVIRTGDRSVMGRIARLTTSTDTNDMPINREINHFVHLIAGVAIFMGVLFFCLGFAVGTYWASNIAFMIGIIVANVPEGLLITVTICLTLTANRMAASAVVVKNMKSVETLGSTTCICSDKTGTLTQNIMTVQHLCFDGSIYDAKCGTNVDNIDKKSPTYLKMLRVANVCNTAKFDQKSKAGGLPFQEQKQQADGSFQTKTNWRCIGDATESALIKFVQALGIDVDEMRNQYEQLASIPFNSANKYMVCVNKVPGSSAGPLVTMKGAPEPVLARCDRIMINGEIVPLEGEVLQRVVDMVVQCSSDGLRVLGFAELECDAAQFPPNYKYETENCNFPVGNQKDKKYVCARQQEPTTGGDRRRRQHHQQQQCRASNKQKQGNPPPLPSMRAFVS
jgi:sodium/potassium-transporting ATPase subunit alpha